MQLPHWLKHYQRADLPHDLVASLTLLVLLIPQGLAYALLAGLPPQVGLYASIAPVLVYALIGSSATLSVGPAALPALMTGTALASLGASHRHEMVALAAMIALLSGGLRLALGLMRFGFIANFLSQSVVGGFVSGSAVLIVLSQLPQLLGLTVSGHTASTILLGLVDALPQTNFKAAILALGALVLLYVGKHHVQRWLISAGIQPPRADLLAKAFPILVVALGGMLVPVLGWQVRVIGSLPAGLPPFSLPSVADASLSTLLPAVLAIALVGFVDSFSIAQTLALKRRESVDPDRELLALGAANAAAGLTGGFPVSGSFGRSAANELAGARTQLAGVLSAVWIGVTLLVLTHLFATLPLAVLSATIVMAVSQMLDLSILRLAWRYDRRDALVYLATFAAVLALGVVDAIMIGVGLSLALFVWRTSQPHLAVLGRVSGTEHFRNVVRYSVETHPDILTVRIDESLYFANIRFVRARLVSLLHDHPTTRHLLLVCSAINAIDVSALQGLRELNQGLAEQGVQLHFSVVKGPVMDLLKRSGLLGELSGQVFLSTHQAMTELSALSAPDFSI